MKARKVVAGALFFLSLAAVAICAFPALFPWEERFVQLFCETLPRLMIAAFLLVSLWGKPPCVFGRKALFAFVWSLPCFAVALANFPFSALITGAARIERLDLLWIFLIKCFTVALVEELFFRALLLPFLREKFKNIKGEFFLSVLLSAALFSLIHILNLFSGASLGTTMSQMGYTFLLGVMFGVMVCITENVWACVGVHFLFDVGGLLVSDLGAGPFHDTIFWILTAVAGILCAIYLSVSVYRAFHKKKS